MSGHADMQADDLEGQLRNAKAERDLWHHRHDQLLDAVAALRRSCDHWRMVAKALQKDLKS